MKSKYIHLADLNKLDNVENFNVILFCFSNKVSRFHFPHFDCKALEHSITSPAQFSVHLYVL